MQNTITRAIGFVLLVFVLQDCLIPASAARVRVVKVRKNLDGHYTKRQAPRNSYTDLPLAGDPNPDTEAYRPNNYQGQNYNNQQINPQPQRQPQNFGDRAVGNQQQPLPQRQEIRPSRQEKEKGEDCPGCGNSIPGDAGIDYPNYATPPKTSFSCSKQSYSGYYADTEARCQVFWICQKNRADAFLCPNGTIFNQQVFVCDWWFNSDCNTAPDYYSRNQYLYAGPTVDIFGNSITINQNPTGTNPITSQSVRTTVAPIRLQASTPLPPNYGNPTQAPIRQTTSYNKRSQHSSNLAHNQLQYNDQAKPAPLRQQGYPVPDNSLEVLENSNNANQGFGARMNNYRTAVQYNDRSSQRQQNGNTWTYSKNQTPQSQRQQSYNNYNNQNQNQNQNYNNNRNYNTGQYDSASYSDERTYSTNDNQRYLPQTQERGYNQQNNRQNYNNNYNNNGYNNNYNADYRQPLFSATEPVASSVEVSTVGYGQKSTVKSAASKTYEDSTSSADVDSSAGSSSPVAVAASASSPLYTTSTTTKRNAIDYDTENTTPLVTDSLDEDLVSTLTTPRYGEVVSQPSPLSTELEPPSDEDVTTTVAPLTFGQKLTRAARKRNTSRWGNWRTMLLGEEY